MATKSAVMNTATIGPESWRTSTLKTIKLSQNIVHKSDKSCDIGRALDPLPVLRDSVVQLSNEEVQRYSREVRTIVAQLRASLLDTNEEIKSLTRGKEALEKAHEHIRKDIKLNKNCHVIRLQRPETEREHDGADDLLSAERSHLVNLKKTIETQVLSVQQQLHVLDVARHRLFDVIQERSRVLDLISHAMSSVDNHAPARSKSFVREGTAASRFDHVEPGSQVDPLGPYTPEADNALLDAKEARTRAAYLRAELKAVIQKSDRLQKAAHKSVNDGLTMKLSETITLQQHLGVGLGETRHGIHRAQRWFDATEKARSYTLGPLKSTDLMTKERMDRPLVKIFQRHPGTQVPDCQEIIRGGEGLLHSLTATSRNIGLLKLAQMKLGEDVRSKRLAASIDADILRLRRRCANHRWTSGSAF